MSDDKRLKDVRERLERLNKRRSEMVGELKGVDAQLVEMGVGVNPAEIDAWLKDQTKKLTEYEQQAETLFEQLEELLDEIENQ